MAFIPGFEHDIFISYAHVDNILETDKNYQWIERFYKNLNVMLAKRFGRMDMVKIWWDSKKLDGNILFDDSIEDGIRKSAVFICLNSPGYVQSEYCNKELQLFYNKAKTEKDGIKVGNRSRIVHVLLNNIFYKDWPTPLRGTTGFPFHDAKTKKEFGETLDPSSKLFRAQMIKLREALFDLISNMAKNDLFENVLIDDKLNKNKDFSIYLGEVPDTLRTPRKRIVSELEKNGFHIISGSPPPQDDISLTKQTSEDLKKSSLAVHLLDKYPGREIIDAKDNWYTKKQVEIGLDTDGSQMIWIPDEMDLKHVEEDNYREFLYNLETGNAAYKEYEFIKGSKSNLAKVIIEYADKLKVVHESNSQNTRNLNVLIDTHFNDQIIALDICKRLLDNKVQPFINPQANDPRQNMDMLKSRLQEVNKVVFIYGNIAKEWVVERMTAVLQLVIENNYSIEDFYVYIIGEEKDSSDVQLNQRYLKIYAFQNTNNSSIEDDIFNIFVNRLTKV